MEELGLRWIHDSIFIRSKLMQGTYVRYTRNCVYYLGMYELSHLPSDRPFNSNSNSAVTNEPTENSTTIHIPPPSSSTPFQPSFPKPAFFLIPNLLSSTSTSLPLPRCSSKQIIPILYRHTLRHMIHLVNPHQPLRQFEHVIP